MRKIVIIDGYALNPGDLRWEGLGRLGEVVIYDRTPHNLILERSAGATALITNKVVLKADIMARLPELKYIGVTATGYNVVDTDAANDRDIVVTNVPAYSTNSVAQMVFAYVLKFCNHVQAHTDAVHAGEWVASPDFCFWKYPQIELEGKTIGIVGFGSIGRRVARIAAAFGMGVLASSRARRNAPDIGHFEWADLHGFLRRSDSSPCTPRSRTRLRD